MNSKQPQIVTCRLGWLVSAGLGYRASTSKSFLNAGLGFELIFALLKKIFLQKHCSDLCTCLVYEVSAAYAYLPKCNSCLQFTKTPKCIHQFACVTIHLCLPCHPWQTPPFTLCLCLICAQQSLLTEARGSAVKCVSINPCLLLFTMHAPNLLHQPFDDPPTPTPSQQQK